MKFYGHACRWRGLRVKTQCQTHCAGWGTAEALGRERNKARAGAQGPLSAEAYLCLGFTNINPVASMTKVPALSVSDQIVTSTLHSLAATSAGGQSYEYQMDPC